MASTSENWDEEEALAKWRRLGELGLEAGLWEVGCSKKDIAKLCHLDRSQTLIPSSQLHFDFSSERAAFFTMVGQAGSSVKSLNLCLNLSTLERFEWLTLNDATALCANLASNTNIEELELSGHQVFGTVKGCTLLGNALRANSALQTLVFRHVEMDDHAVKLLMDRLQENKTLLYLGFYESSLSEEGIKSVAEFVTSNMTLTMLGLDLVSANVAELKLMTRMNKSLSILKLGGARFKPEDWRDEILPALKENESIQELDLYYSKGLTRKDVKDALMDLLQSSKIGLTRVNLGATDISNLQGQVDEELRLNSEYRTRLQGQATVQTTAGRLILCGFGYAGKTSISETMEGICHKTAKSRSKSFKRKIKQTFPCLQQIFFGNDAYRELASRTRGFNVVSLDTEGYLKSIWDFAGQKAYYVLHDYLFPNNKNSCFLYVSSSRYPPTAQDRKGAIKSEEKMRIECEYWMKFIASNAKPRLTGDNNENHLPRVRFVITKKNTLTPPQLRTSKQWAQHVVRDLKDVFKDVLQLCESVEFVDARSSEDVEHLVTLIDESLKEILEHQREYTICQDVRNILAKQHVDNHVT